jgi:hypothetical protein
MEGVRYVLQFTCVARKWFYSYELVSRTGDDVLRCLKDLVEKISGGAQDPKVSC